VFFHHRLIKRSEERNIVSAIKEAEKNTSGEIRVHIENICPEEDPVARAIFIFDAIGMFDTAERNGVLIYVALKSRKFAVIGDVGINSVAKPGFWDGVKRTLSEFFEKEEIAEGIKYAVIETGKILKDSFPHKEDDKNEQPDEISYGR
jgi:uncharacterized membrane protein